MTVILLITTDNEKTIEHPLLERLTLGRSGSCDLKIDDRQMSGKHGCFELKYNGEVIYTDLESTNGSLLNNYSVKSSRFRIGETIRIGNTNICIDEKSLNSRERLGIGKALNSNNDNTILLPSIDGGIMPPDSPSENPDAKKVLSLNKSHKSKSQNLNWRDSTPDSVIEKEKSTGNTKMLKLDSKKIKKK